MMKTAVTVLQEMMIKTNLVPEYKCISQTGPQHQATFEYRCEVWGIGVTGRARSKKEAKQDAAKRMLIELHARGMHVPQPFAAEPLETCPPAPPSPSNDPALEAGTSRPSSAPGTALDARSYVALLRELCDEYRLGEAQYELVGDTGPPHLRRFTVRASLGQHERSATANTKKAARQLAAELLYTYLRENLQRLTKDFVEEEALQRAQERAVNRARLDAALARYGDHVAGGETPELPRRPDLGQRVAQYHLSLFAQLGEESCARAEQALRDAGTRADAEPEATLQSLCDDLSLRMEHHVMGPQVAVVRVLPTAPPLTFAATTRRGAAAAALRYMRRSLCARAP